MIYRFALVAALCVCLFTDVHAQVDAPQIVSVLKSRVGDFNDSHTTFVFLASSSQCFGCGSSAINWVARRAASAGLDVNQVVVVRVAVKGDGLALKNKFLVKSIIEDLDGSILLLANAEDKPGITFVAVASDGHLLRVVYDLQHDLDTAGKLVDSLSRKSSDFQKLVLRPVKMAPGVVVVEAASPRYVSGGGSFKFIETAQNRICQVDLQTAFVSYADSSPAELAFYFWTLPQTDTLRKSLLENYSPLVRIQDILSCSGDTTTIIGYLFTGYKMADLPNGKKRANVQSANAKAVMVKSRLIAASLLPRSPYLLQYPLTQLGDGTWIGQCVWESYYADTSLASKYPDSLRLLVRLGRDLRSSYPLLVLADLEKAYGRRMFALYIKTIARLGRNALFYLDGGNRLMLRLQDSLGTMVFNKLQAGSGSLLGRLLAGDYKQSADTDITIVGAAPHGGGVDVVMYIHHNGTQPHTMAVARFDEHGTYMSEQHFNMPEVNADDVYIGSVLVGTDSDDSLRFMLRMKSAGWLLGTLR